MLSEQIREYIRHPSDIPISIATEKANNQMNLELNNISTGGLAFDTPSYFEQGSVVNIRINTVKPSFRVKGIVAWCEPKDGHYEVGVEFVGHKDAYRVRMVEQLCHIEHYKKLVKAKEGRVISGEAAATEWIKKYASTFPNPNP